MSKTTTGLVSPVAAPVSFEFTYDSSKVLESSASVDAQNLGRIVFDPGGPMHSTSLASFSIEEISSFRVRGQPELSWMNL